MLEINTTTKNNKHVLATLINVHSISNVLENLTWLPHYETVVSIKIYPLCHGFSFYPSLSFLFFLYPLTTCKNLERRCWLRCCTFSLLHDENSCLWTREINCSPPPLSLLTDAMFCHVLYYIVNFIIVLIHILMFFECIRYSTAAFPC